MCFPDRGSWMAVRRPILRSGIGTLPLPHRIDQDQFPSQILDVPNEGPLSGKRTPVFCDRISFVVLKESPVFIVVLSGRLCARPFGKKNNGFPLDVF